MATFTWALAAGKDLNWDQLNYHFYIAHSLIEGRLSRDFMAANVQSYFNPLAYVPFYAMIRHEWHSYAIVFVLSCLHSLNIALAFFITREIIPDDHGALWWGLVGALFTFLSPIFLLEAGTTFADISTAVLVLLAALLLLVPRQGDPQWHYYVLIAGLAGGAAAGMKLSNIIYTPALAAMILFVPYAARARLSAMALLAIGGSIGSVLTHGYWSYLLWREFKNPFFPLFNNVFASPDYPLISHRHERFLPNDLWDVLSFPVRIVALRSWVYVESIAPDLRFLALGAVAIIGSVRVGYRALAKKTLSVALPKQLVALAVFFILAYLLWMYTSGNGRYGIVVSLLVGPLLVSFLYIAFRHLQSKHVFVMLIALALVQTIHLQDGQYRWTSGQWTKTWFDQRVPDELAEKSFLYLSIGAQSNSFIAPFLSQGSAFTNPIGQVSVDLDGPGGMRIIKMLERYDGRVRMLSRAPKYQDHSSMFSWSKGVNALLSRFDLIVDTNSCLDLDADGVTHESGEDFEKTDPQRRRLISCMLVRQPKDTDLARERERVKVIVDGLVTWCPKMFKPAYTVIERKEDGWFANFADSDIVVRIEGGNVLMTQTRSTADVFLGTLDALEHGIRPDNCSVMPRHLREKYNFD